MFLSPSVIDGHGEADGAPLWVQDKKLVEEEPRTMCTSSAPLTGIKMLIIPHDSASLLVM